MERLSGIISRIDNFVWGPAMLVLMVGTGIFLTFRTRFLTWRNLGYALKKTFSREARQTSGAGDISPFSALTTALAATIGTGNIVGVSTAMVAGGPGALVWMCISAVFGLSSKFGECMLAVKYREVNEQGEMSGGPMYTMKKGFRNKRLGASLGWLFALFAVLASFGIGNMTQANSISDALYSTFNVPLWITGAVTMALIITIILGGIKTISKVSSIVVPLMGLFYIAAGIAVILCNYENMAEGIGMIFKMAFSLKAAGGGLCGTITASLMSSMRYGVARGVFSNEAGMGSAAISAAAAASDCPVSQGYINMTGTFWDTIVVCTITGLCIAGSGVLGATETEDIGTYIVSGKTVSISVEDANLNPIVRNYEIRFDENRIDLIGQEDSIELYNADLVELAENSGELSLNGMWSDTAGNHYIFDGDGGYEYRKVIKGAALTILAFESALGPIGGWLLCIGIVLFAFSTILGWEYQGEKAFEYILKSNKYNKLYRIVYSILVYFGAATALDIVWGFSDIANALMAVPNLICLLVLSKEISEDIREFETVRRAEKSSVKK